MLQISNLNKHFGGVRALKDVSMRFEGGKVYGLAGENGAGKSTLVKLLCGVYREFKGKIEFEGRAFAPNGPSEAEQAGIAVFHQEIPVCPNLSVAANIFLGPKLPVRRWSPDWKAMELRCRQLFHDLLGVEIDPRQKMGRCTAAQRQLALLVRVLSRNGRVLILDEPTTALTPVETARLFSVIRRLKQHGICVVFISHVLDELVELSDELYVLRDGSLVGHLARGDFSTEHIASLLAGHKQLQDAARNPIGPTPKLAVVQLDQKDAFADISFQVHAGEILGLAGLQGSGRSAIARALFASPPAHNGTISLDGKQIALKSPRDAIAAGIGYVPEDRKRLGLFDDLDIAHNLGLLRLRWLVRFGTVSRRGLWALTEHMQQELQIKMPSPSGRIMRLSGGNQQKVLISRWLTIEPKVLVLNEPTRGVDVGAKAEIWRLLRQLANRGCAVVVSSSDLDELIALSDRILVTFAGRLRSEYSKTNVSKRGLIHAIGTGSTEPLTRQE